MTQYNALNVKLKLKSGLANGTEVTFIKWDWWF